MIVDDVITAGTSVRESVGVITASGLGYRFDGWSGACRSLHACTLHPKAAVKVTATFRKTHS